MTQADPLNPYANLTDDQVVQAGKNALAATDVEMARRLKNSLEKLDLNISGLRNEITEGQQVTNRFNKRLYWLTTAIFFLGAVQVAVVVYQVFYP